MVEQCHGDVPHPCRRRPSRRATLVGGLVAALGVGVAVPQAHANPTFAGTVIAASPILGILVACDVEAHLLPNRWTGTLAGIVGVGLVADAIRSETPAGVRVLLGAAALGLSYLALALLGAGQGMGLGDVKLAPSLGALLAWPGWSTWCVGAMGAFLLGGLWGIGLMVRGRGRTARMPFGPFMIVASLFALLLG